MINSFFKQAFDFKVLDNEKYDEYKNKYYPTHHISSVKKQELINMVDVNNINFYICFWFEKIREWIIKNEIYTDEYINNLEKILGKLYLKNKIGSYEYEYINHIKAVVFAKKRNLKRLIVDFPLQSFVANKKRLVTKKIINELVYFNFSNSDFVEIDIDKNKKLMSKCELYISNHRLIFSSHYKVLSIHFKDIKNFIIKNHKLFISLDLQGIKKNFFINSYDNYVLFVSLQRMYIFWQKTYF